MDTAKILIRVILGLNQTKSGHTAFSTVYSGKKLGADFLLEVGSLHSHFIFQDLFQGDRYTQATTLLTNYYQWDSCSMTQAASESLGKIG